MPGADGKLHPIPGWHTTGPFDFDAWAHNVDWDGVGSDLGEIANGALTFMAGGAAAAKFINSLGYKIGPDIVRGIVQGHHSLPKFMGGPVRQELNRIHQSLHGMFHEELAAALKGAKFPRIGGRGGSAEDWAKHFEINPASKDEALDILRNVTRRFDKMNGTKISHHLEATLAKGKTASPNVRP